MNVSRDRKSTRLNSSHGYISYAVFCLKKKKTKKNVSHCLWCTNIIHVTFYDPTRPYTLIFFFFFNDTATTEIYTLSLHDALPILVREEAEELVPDNGTT